MDSVDLDAPVDVVARELQRVIVRSAEANRSTLLLSPVILDPNPVPPTEGAARSVYQDMLLLREEAALLSVQWRQLQGLRTELTEATVNAVLTLLPPVGRFAEGAEERNSQAIERSTHAAAVRAISALVDAKRQVIRVRQQQAANGAKAVESLQLQQARENAERAKLLYELRVLQEREGWLKREATNSLESALRSGTQLIETRRTHGSKRGEVAKSATNPVLDHNKAVVDSWSALNDSMRSSLQAAATVIRQDTDRSTQQGPSMHHRAAVVPSLVPTQYLCRIL